MSQRHIIILSHLWQEDRHMTIEQLSHFVEVCRYQSITKAADNLYVTRQSISTSIKKLETEFGVTLFTRVPNGVTLTNAGQTLYFHATNILNESSALKENLRKYSSKQENIPACRIGIVESLLTLYGNELLAKLSATFPDTYFDFSMLNVSEDFGSLPNLDIAISVISDEQFTALTAQHPPQIGIKKIQTLPCYVWISSNSAWNEYTTLDFSLLKDAPYCNLKNSYSNANFLHYLNTYYPSPSRKHCEIPLNQTFIDYIEKFGYYTIDFQLVNHCLLYTDLFKNHNILCKKTHLNWHVVTIYNKKVASNFQQLINNHLAEKLQV